MISVIVPVYNVMPYLEQCVGSLLGQTYKELEIIIVDDGSTDGGNEECEQYSSLDSRIKIIHKTNGGLSSARNAGMEHAVGDWIFFVDSDDWLDSDALFQLLQFAVSNNCDIVQCNHYYAYEHRLLYRSPSKIEKVTTVLNNAEAMKQLIINDRIKNFAWGKLYKADLIRHLKFPEGKYFEDSFWQHHVFHKATRIGLIDVPLYYYRQRMDSISGTPSAKFQDLIEGNSQRLEFIGEFYPGLHSLMEKKLQELSVSFHSTGNKNHKIMNSVKKIVNRIKTARKFRSINL